MPQGLGGGGALAPQLLLAADGKGAGPAVGGGVAGQALALVGADDSGCEARLRLKRPRWMPDGEALRCKSPR